MTTSKPVGVGLIGYGFAGKTFHAPLIRAVDGLALRAIASSDAAKVKKDFPGMTVFANPADMIAADGIELIVIATPNDSHAPLARAALSAGRHVVIDKPFTLDMAEARELIALAERQSRLLSVFHNRRWDSDFLAAKFGVESGVLGTVTHFESHIDRFRPEVRDRWRERAEPGAGVWYDLAPHLIDQTLQLFGLPQSVQANFMLQRPGAQAVDWAHAVLTYPQHRAVLHASMIAAGGVPRFLVHGDKGSLVKNGIDQQEAQLLERHAARYEGLGRRSGPHADLERRGRMSGHADAGGRSPPLLHGHPRCLARRRSQCRAADSGAGGHGGAGSRDHIGRHRQQGGVTLTEEERATFTASQGKRQVRSILQRLNIGLRPATSGFSSDVLASASS